MTISEPVWAAIVQFVLGPSFVIIVGAILSRTLSKKIKNVREEITNSHPVHLREDLDSKFKLVNAKIDTILDEQKELDRKMDAQLDDVSELYKTVADHEKRLTGQAGKLRRISNKP
jgi:peptidoglycan hydrolase CwlO-like protein